MKSIHIYVHHTHNQLTNSREKNPPSLRFIHVFNLIVFFLPSFAAFLAFSAARLTIPFAVELHSASFTYFFSPLFSITSWHSFILRFSSSSSDCWFSPDFLSNRFHIFFCSDPPPPHLVALLLSTIDNADAEYMRAVLLCICYYYKIHYDSMTIHIFRESERMKTYPFFGVTQLSFWGAQKKIISRRR